MWPILLMTLPEKYNAGISPRYLTNMQAPKVNDDAFKVLRNTNKNVSTAPHRNPMIDNITKRRNMAGCFISVKMSRVIAGFLGICGSLKNIAATPVMQIQMSNPMKQGVKLISLVTEPYLFIAMAEIMAVIIAPIVPHTLVFPKLFRFSPRTA